MKNYRKVQRDKFDDKLSIITIEHIKGSKVSIKIEAPTRKDNH